MTTVTLLSCIALIALAAASSIEIELPTFTVCDSEEFYDAMETTCVSPLLPALRPLKSGVENLEQFGELCCREPCSIRYFVHLCIYDNEDRRKIAYGDRRKRSVAPDRARRF